MKKVLFVMVSLILPFLLAATEKTIPVMAFAKIEIKKDYYVSLDPNSKDNKAINGNFTGEFITFADMEKGLEFGKNCLFVGTPEIIKNSSSGHCEKANIYVTRILCNGKNEILWQYPKQKKVTVIGAIMDENLLRGLSVSPVYRDEKITAKNLLKEVAGLDLSEKDPIKLKKYLSKQRNRIVNKITNLCLIKRGTVGHIVLTEVLPFGDFIP
jgi:hypothetical protein